MNSFVLVPLPQDRKHDEIRYHRADWEMHPLSREPAPPLQEHHPPPLSLLLFVLQLYHVHTGAGRSPRNHQHWNCRPRPFRVAHWAPREEDEAAISCRE